MLFISVHENKTLRFRALTFQIMTMLPELCFVSTSETNLKFGRVTIKSGMLTTSQSSNFCISCELFRHNISHDL